MSLRRDLGGAQIFRDRDDLIAGEHLNDVIAQRLASSDAALFLVGRNWFGVEEGVRRIDRSDDPVRLEVELAVSSETSATPIPVLVDVGDVPAGPPACIDELFARLAVRATREDLRQTPGLVYQEILVGVWASIRDRVDGGLLVMSDGTDRGAVAINSLIQELNNESTTGVRELCRYASGAAIYTVDEADRLAKRWPDVIVVGHNSSASPTLASPTLMARAHAVAAHPSFQRISLIGLGAAAPAAAGALQSFANPGEWISTMSTGPTRWTRRLVRAVQARPRVAALAVLGAAGIGAAAVVAIPDDTVSATVEHAGFEYSITDTRTESIPPGVAETADDPDPDVDHHHVRVTVNNLGVDTDRALRFTRIEIADVFDLELADGTVIKSEGGETIDDRSTTTFNMLGEDRAEFWASFPVERGASVSGASLRIHLGDGVPTVVALDAGVVETVVVPVEVVNPLYEGPYGWQGQNRARIEVSNVTASFEAGFDDAGSPLPSPDSFLRRRADDGFVFVRFQANETELETNSGIGASFPGTPRAIVDGVEIEGRGASDKTIGALGTVPVSYSAVIEVPIDARSIAIGFSSSRSAGTYEVYFVAELEMSFLETFRDP